MTKTNESGRSMVEMLGVLAVIGVLSIGGITGYKYAMETIETNKILNFIQLFNVALETEINDPDTPIRAITWEHSKTGPRYERLCSYLPEKYCTTWDTGSLGVYAFPNVSTQRSNQLAYWGAYPDSDSYFNLQFRNLKPSVCEKVLSQATQFDRVVAIGEYWPGTKAERSTTDFSAASIQKLCSKACWAGGTTTVTLIFDAEPMETVALSKLDS